MQVPARIGGLTDTARFARSLAGAATEFAEWCESQTRTSTRTATHHGWPGLGVPTDDTSTDES
ncbi:MAG TPA: hypothetical protein VGD67_25135 [Pseudonocardiaceae bacterium]